MERPRIKICGIGRVEDAVAAARAGADAIGLVFHPPAPRNVTLDKAEKILAALPPFVTAVGLFVDADVQHVREVADRLHLRHVQLHGHESPEQVAELRGLTVLKALRVEREHFREELERWRAAIRQHNLVHLGGFVLETAGTEQAGGTGATNDWETVRRHYQRGDFVGLPAIIAAGGLTPENVGPVVRDLHPWAVDVSSGVEATRGCKSPEKIQAFIKAVRDAMPR